MRTLLEAERGALGEIARSAIEATRGFMRSLGDVAAAAYRLETSLTGSLENARRRGRSVSLQAMQGEYDVARGEAIRAGVNPFSMPLKLPMGNTPNDFAVSSRAAKELVDAFAKKAARSIEGADGRSVSGRSALPVYAIEEKATTQTAESFAEERVQVERRVVHQNTGANWLPLLVKMWDATLDKKTCPLCRDMNEQFRPFGMSFSGGRVPAVVHRRCRCIQVLIFSPIYLGREEREAA